MRVFGCLVYYKNVEANGDKFEPRGKPGVFMGYPPKKKGYKIYDIQQRKMVMTRDVRFVENIFPFSKIELKEYEQEIFEHLDPITECQDLHDRPIENMEQGGVPSQTIEDEGDKTSHEEPIEDIEIWRAPMQTDEIEQTELEATGPDMQSGEEENDIHLEETHEEIPTVQQEFKEERQTRKRTQPRHLSDYHVKLPPSLDHTQPVSN